MQRAQAQSDRVKATTLGEGGMRQIAIVDDLLRCLTAGLGLSATLCGAALAAPPPGDGRPT